MCGSKIMDELGFITICNCFAAVLRVNCVDHE